MVFSWGVVGPTSTLFAGPPPFQAPCWAKGLGGCRSQGCHGYLQAWLASCMAPPKPRHLPQAHRLAMSLNVAECNLGEVKLEPMQSAAVCRKPCAGGSLLQGLLQGLLYCVDTLGMGILGQGGSERLKPSSFYVSPPRSLSWLSQMLLSLTLPVPSS